MKNTDILALDGKLLKTFLAVYESQSVTQASKKLGVGQSSVSHSLNRLRDYLGEPLFVKRGRGIVPTHAADLIAPKATLIVSQMEGLILHKEYDPALDENTFTVATNVTELLPALLALRKGLGMRRSKARLKFVELGDRNNALLFLDTNTADLAITASVGPYPIELSVKQLYQDPIVCFFDPNIRQAPTTLEDYCNAKHAVLDFGGNNKSIVERALETVGLKRQIRLAASNSYALARLTKGSALVATLPRGVASDAFSGFEYCEVPFPLRPVSYDLVWHRRFEDAARHIWFRNVFLEAVSTSPHI